MSMALLLSFGYILNINSHPTYKSEMKVFYKTPQGSENALRNYQELLKTKIVLDSINQKINHKLSSEQIARSLKIEIKSNFDVIKISAVTANPNLSQTLVRAAEQSTKSLFNKLYNTSDQNFEIIDQPTLAHKPIRQVSIPKAIIVSLMTGSMFGLMVIFVMWDFNQEKEEIKQIPYYPQLARLTSEMI